MTLGSNRCLSFLQNCIENDNPDSQTVRIQRIHIEKKRVRMQCQHFYTLAKTERQDF